jgi:small ubiquitin-related modifier
MEVFFKIRKTTVLKRLMEAYCSRQGLQVGNVRFLYDGERLKDDSTPESLNMEDNDVIDAVAQQTGGF